jgi:hypothetical protein
VKTRTRLLGAALLLLALGVSGCFNPFFPTVSAIRAAPEAAPLPDSPQGVLKLFKWCWENRAITEYEELFSQDYRFAFAQADTTGDAYQDRATTRDEDLRQTRNLFVGGAGSSQPPAQRIVLYFDANLIALPDSRPGKTSPWHKEVRTSVDLTIDVGTQVYRVTGYARFFVVRGDSAKIPPDLVERGLHPDAGRWYIERWEDESGSGGTAAAAARPVVSEAAPAAGPAGGRLPAGVRSALEEYVTWGWLKNHYAAR